MCASITFPAQIAQESAEYNLMVEQSNACENNPAYPVNFPSPSSTVAGIPSKGGNRNFAVDFRQYIIKDCRRSQHPIYRRIQLGEGGMSPPPPKIFFHVTAFSLKNFLEHEFSKRKWFRSQGKTLSSKEKMNFQRENKSFSKRKRAKFKEKTKYFQTIF
jgi:hypothetical protein